MAILRRSLPAALAIAIGLFVLADLFLSVPLLDSFGTYFVNMAVIIAGFALFLGMINITRVHVRKIRLRQPGWPYSLLLLFSLLIVLIVGLLSQPSGPSGPAQSFVNWIFESILAPLQATFSALLVFFVVMAAYRLLRVRNLEATVMLVVVLLVLVGQITVGLLPVLPDVAAWIVNVPAMAGVRGILLGVALGALLTGIRLLLGVERPYSD